MTTSVAMAETRIERDFLGEKAVPANAYWGVHTARAIENFPISRQQIGSYPDFIRALAWVKKAAARANAACGALDARLAEAIEQACDDIIAGQLHDQFVVDVIQGGAGTSTNMNANEVIANRALEHLGESRGQYGALHPNDHVNASQSTNDVYPTALHMAAWMGAGRVIEAVAALRGAIEAKAAEFHAVVKIGRTQLQDAVPMTLGQEFQAFASMLAAEETRLQESRELMLEINLGATAIGTSINAPQAYVDRVAPELAAVSGVPVRAAGNLIAATQDTGAFVQMSGVLKQIACKLSKISNDLRLLSSGPQTGIGDILLPARQAGSSIMPGKVNPVIPEVVNQVAFEVIGNDVTIAMASEAGQLQLNAFEPVMGWALFRSLEHLAAACGTLQVNCIEGIAINEEALARRVSESVTLATALNPVIGYEKAAQIVKLALREKISVGAAAEQLGVMSQGELSRLVSAQLLANA